MTKNTDKNPPKYQASPAEIDFIVNRAKEFKFNAKDRIQWIEAAWKMIQHARKQIS